MHDDRGGFDRQGWKTVGAICLGAALLAVLSVLVGFVAGAPVPALAVALFGTNGDGDYVWVPGFWVAFMIVGDAYHDFGLVGLKPAIEGWFVGTTSPRVLLTRIGAFFVAYQVSTLAIGAQLTIPVVFGLPFDDAMAILTVAPLCLLIFHRMWFAHPAPSSEWRRHLPSLAPHAAAPSATQGSDISAGQWAVRLAWRLALYCAAAIGASIWLEDYFGREHPLAFAFVIVGLTGLAGGIGVVGLLLGWPREIAAHFRSTSRPMRMTVGGVLMAAGIIAPAWIVSLEPPERLFECTMLETFPSEHALWAHACAERRSKAGGDRLGTLMVAPIEGVGAFLGGVKILADAALST